MAALMAAFGAIGSYLDADPTVPRLLIAVLLGSLIGVERQWHQRTAGLRTNALVCLGAASFVDLGGALAPNSAGTLQITAYVVSGVGFLGAGTIMKEGVNVRGLNTAATLWCSAAVGASAGAGETVAAIATCALVILVNSFLRRIVQLLDKRGAIVALPEVEALYLVRVLCTAQEEAHVRALLLHAFGEAGLSLRELDSADLEDRPGRVEVKAAVAAAGRHDAALERIAGRLSLEPSVAAVRWRVAEPAEES
jgi:putative Mg2+ transporter-C (MgtC) family protein